MIDRPLQSNIHILSGEDLSWQDREDLSQKTRYKVSLYEVEDGVYLRENEFSLFVIVFFIVWNSVFIFFGIEDFFYSLLYSLLSLNAFVLLSFFYAKHRTTKNIVAAHNAKLTFLKLPGRCSLAKRINYTVFLRLFTVYAAITLSFRLMVLLFFYHHETGGFSYAVIFLFSLLFLSPADHFCTSKLLHLFYVSERASKTKETLP